MAVTESGIVAEMRFLFWNALLPIVVTVTPPILAGMSISFGQAG